MAVIKAPKIETLTAEIHKLVENTADNILEIGKRLNMVKDMLAENPDLGTFTEWLDREFAWSQNTARRYMRIALRFSDTHHSGGFASNTLYLLSLPSVEAEAVDEALERASEGERITAAKAKEIIAKYRSIEDAMEGMSPEERLQFIKDEQERERAEAAEAPEPKTPLERYESCFAKLAKYDRGLPKPTKAEKLRAKYESEVKYQLG